MSLPRYRTYKASGIEWLGEVPAHWEVKRADAVLSYEKEQARIERFRDSEVFYYSIPLIQETGDGALVSGEEIESDKILLKGDELLVSKLNPRKGMVLISRPHDVPIVCSTEFVPMRAVGCELDFAYWLYACEPVRRLISSTVQSVTRSHQRANPADITKQLLVFPSRDEQVTISRFLRNATEHIDALIAEQERLIKLLKEKRQAVTSHAVTKGLNPDAPMKVSGIDWLGEVPDHWRVMPIRKAARLESGHTPSRLKPEYWQACEVPWVTLSDVWQIREAKTDYIVETKEKISEMGLANSSARLLPRGTVMLSRTASVGFAAIMGVDMATSQDFANWVCGPDLIPEYLLHVLRSMKGELQRLMMGSTHNTVYMPDIQSLSCAIPSLSEQRAIVAHIASKTKGLDSLMDDSLRSIELLQERRSALISAAVTGKIDVRHLADAEAA